jgi:2-polyprenyl-3-methyl-5-hydroxy-6-metoxy-1,4-benzoquinol methylase
MDWKIYWDRQGKQNNALKQVARTGYNEERMQRLMVEQAQYVADKLQLTQQSVVLDTCCGNGVFTQLISKHCKQVVGIDLSTVLIEKAQLTNNAHTRFYTVDILNLQQWDLYHSFEQSFDAISLCFSFQYFETVAKGLQVIENLLPLLKPGQSILLTDVPDRARFFWHYNNLSKLLGLAVQMAKNKNEMGKFWGEEELRLICKTLGVSGQKLIQPTHFPYAHYRMDYLITKP